MAIRRYDPWKDAAERYPDFHIQKMDILPAHGGLLYREKVILIEISLSRADVRHTLGHEVAHLDLRHRQCLSGQIDRRTEQGADQLAARRLIDIAELADVLAYRLDLHHACEHLQVPISLLELRLKHLHPADRGVLNRACAHHREAS